MANRPLTIQPNSNLNHPCDCEDHILMQFRNICTCDMSKQWHLIIVEMFLRFLRIMQKETILLNNKKLFFSTGTNILFTRLRHCGCDLSLRLLSVSYRLIFCLSSPFPEYMYVLCLNKFSNVSMQIFKYDRLCYLIRYAHTVII